MDCFELVEKGRYGILKEKHCPGDCSVRKTKEEQVRSLEKAKARLRSLPKVEQQAIAERYYGGVVRW